MTTLFEPFPGIGWGKTLHGIEQKAVWQWLEIFCSKDLVKNCFFIQLKSNIFKRERLLWYFRKASTIA